VALRAPTRLLPLVSYGGTAMLTVLFACGLLLGINVHRDLVIPRP